DAVPLHEAPLDGDVCLAVGGEDHGCSPPCSPRPTPSPTSPRSGASAPSTSPSPPPSPSPRRAAASGAPDPPHPGGAPAGLSPNPWSEPGQVAPLHPQTPDKWVLPPMDGCTPPAHGGVSPTPIPKASEGSPRTMTVNRAVNGAPGGYPPGGAQARQARELLEEERRTRLAQLTVLEHA